MRGIFDCNDPVWRNQICDRLEVLATHQGLGGKKLAALAIDKTNIGLDALDHLRAAGQAWGDQKFFKEVPVEFELIVVANALDGMSSDVALNVPVLDRLPGPNTKTPERRFGTFIASLKFS